MGFEEQKTDGIRAGFNFLADKLETESAKMFYEIESLERQLNKLKGEKAQVDSALAFCRKVVS